MKQQAAKDYTLHCAKYNSSVFVVWILDHSSFPCVYYHTYQGLKARFSYDTSVENYIFYFFVPDNVFVVHTILKCKLEYMFQCVNSISHFLKPSLFWTLISCSEYLCLCQVWFFYFVWNIVTKHLPKAHSSWFWSEIFGQILTFHNIFSLTFSWLILLTRIVSSLKSHRFSFYIAL